MSVADLTPEQAHQIAREDFRTARESRMALDEIKLRSYKAYRIFSEDVQGGTKTKDGNGPFGWSRLQVPLVFWVVETILPRIGVQPPTVIAKPLSPAATKKAVAKQMRLERQFKLANMGEHQLLAIKQMLILGDGPLKVRWISSGPGVGFATVEAIDWFDWFVSAEARLWHEAECLMHRTWQTKRDLAALIKRQKDLPKRERAYDVAALEAAYEQTTVERSTADTTWAARRTASGLGMPDVADHQALIPFVECHYRDGTLVTVAGEDAQILVRHEREPLMTRPDGQGFRPFSVLQNTPDLFQPYSISDAEMVLDHQHEAQQLRRMAMDQTTKDIFRGAAYDESMVTAAKAKAFYERPGALIGVKGDPSRAFQEFQAPARTMDWERFYNNIVLSEVAQISGVNDISQGIASRADTTATEAAAVREEANERFRMKLHIVSLGMTRIAHMFDWLDRAFSLTDLMVPMDSDSMIPPGAEGIKIDPMNPGMAAISPMVNDPEAEYEIELDAGSMIPPAKSENAARLRDLVADIMNLGPQFANVPELLRMMVEVNGHDPDRVLMPAAPPAPLPPPPGPPPGPAGGAPLPPEAAPPAAPPVPA